MLNKYTRNLFIVALFFAFTNPKWSWAQTNPTSQSIPYTQNFGTSTFTSMPTGMIAWTGLSGATLSTQTSAESSVPTSNATLTTATAAQTGGGTYGYAVSSNGRLYIQTSSNSSSGANQVALAIVTTGLSNITVSYDVEIVSAQPRTVGIVMQYRVGTTGAWTTASGTGNPYSQAAGTTGVKVSPSIILPSGANNQSVVQIRWATWRGIETGNSSGIAIDNISVISAPPAPTLTSITPGDGQLGLAFTAPSSNGGSTITNYKYSTDGGSTFTACSPTQTTSPISITGLTNGTSYNVQIKAVNAVGDGTATISTAATPRTTPSAPTINAITPSSTSLSVDFSAGTNGGSTITDYKYSVDNGATFISAASTTNPITISGLTASTSYHVKLRAVNAAGDGTPSTSYAVSTSGGGCTPPSTQATSFTASFIKSTSATIGYTRGNGTKILVVARQGVAISTSPSSSTAYTANTIFASGDALGTGYIVYNGTANSFSLTGLTYNTTYHLAFYEFDDATNCYNTSSPLTGSFNTATPSITVSNVSANPIDFGSLVYPAQSAEANFTMSGNNLVGNLTITAPTGFELATSSSGPYHSSLSYTPSNENVSSSFVYVRFNPSSANGTNSGNLALAATGATTQNVGVTAVALASEPTTTSSITFGTQTTSSVIVNLSGGNGAKRIVIMRSGSAVNFTPADATTYSGVNTSYAIATDQSNGNKIVYDGTGASLTITGLTSNTTYHFAVFEYNIGTNSSSNYLNTSGINSVFIPDNAVYTADNAGTDLTENLNSLATSGTGNSTLPTGWFISTSTYDATAGTATAAGVYSCGTSANTDRSLGTLSTNASSPSIGFKFINSSNEILTSIKIAYYGEQWRMSTANRTDKMSFAYSTDATSLTTGTWNTYTALDFTAPITTGSLGALDGNANSNRTFVTSTITNMSIPNSGTIWFRWTDFNASGNDDILAIDDIVITPFSNTTTTSAPNPTPGIINNLNIYNDATLTGDVTVSGKLNIEAGKKITLNGNTLTINGNIVGTPTFVSDATSKLSIGGAGTIGIINFDQTTPGVTNKLKDLTLNRSSATITLANALQITDNGTVTVSAGTLASGGNLTLTSTLWGTARIAELGSGASITGNVEIQRYMVGGASSQRGWRCMSTPVSGATYAQLLDDIFITGPGGTASGFDLNGSNSSVIYYEESATRGWKSITNPTNAWSAGKGALVFFRGDRTQTSSLTNTNVAPNSFALDYSGTINSGDVTVALDFSSSGLAGDQGWNLIGNPYPSQIDWANVNRSVNTDSYYYILNPNTKNYVSQNTGNIAISQAFFVLVDAATSITFQENDKTANTGTAYFKTAVNPFTIKMKLDNIQYDVATLNFESNTNKNYVFKEDAIKLKNSVYNLAFVTPNNKEVQYNVVNYLASTGTDTFDLSVTSTTNTTYTLNFTNFDQVPLNKAILLVDKLNSNLVNLRVTPDYTFSINNANSATFGNRFALVITDQYTALPVKINSFTGKNSGNNNHLSWTSSSEKNILSYEVQRSNDGIHFETIGLVKPTNNNTTNRYSFLDEGVINIGIIYYRLKIVEAKSTEYSLTISISNSNSFEVLDIYPNPAENILNIKVPQNTCIHHIKIVDPNGTLLLETSNTAQLDVSALAKGVYLINIQTDNTIKTLKFVKK